MTDAQKKAYDAYHDSGVIIPAAEEGLGSPLVLSRLFPEPMERCIVEIGFGMGSALALMAEKNPHCGYLGIEVHTPGVARLLWEIENRKLRNIRIIHGDAVSAVRGMIPAGAVFAFHIFFPDPWPKKRHHKRRLLSTEFLRLLATRLTDAGYLYIVTDWEDYAVQVRQALADIPELRPLTHPEKIIPWRPETAFEKKGKKAGRKIHEIIRLHEN